MYLRTAINPVCAARRQAQAPGYTGRNLPARAMADVISKPSPSVLIRYIRADPWSIHSVPIRVLFGNKPRTATDVFIS